MPKNNSKNNNDSFLQANKEKVEINNRAGYRVNKEPLANFQTGTVKELDIKKMTKGNK